MRAETIGGLDAEWKATLGLRWMLRLPLSGAKWIILLWPRGLPYRGRRPDREGVLIREDP